MSELTNIAQTVLEQAALGQDPVTPPNDIHGAPVMMVPANWRLQKVPGWRVPQPDRIRASVNFTDCASLGRYVGDFKNENSLIFMSESAPPTFLCLLDYHEPDDDVPSWCTHRASFTPITSHNWEAWKAYNRRDFTQVEFALFLEEHSLDVKDPPGADLLGIINTFEVEGVVRYQKVQRLQDGGVKFSFQNETKARSGEITVPEIFRLQFPLYRGEPPVVMEARLRYRLSQEGSLKLRYELVHLDLILESAALSLIERVKTATAIQPLRGNFESQDSTQEG